MEMNPIIEKELRTKLRGWRSTILICCYVIFLVGILLLYFSGRNMIGPRSMQSFNPRIAVEGYNLLITFQFALLFLAVPAMTATAISSERERQTLDLMLVSQTPVRKIILGKITVSLAHTMLLLVASMPVAGVVFFFGGIGFLDIMKLLLFYALTAFFVASCGVFFSTLFKRNIVSIITTYIFLGLITFGPFIGFLIYVLIQEKFHHGFNPSYRVYVAALFPSSVFGFTSLYFGGTGANYGYGIMWNLFDIVRDMDIKMTAETGLWRFMYPWLVNGVFHVVSSVLLIFFSTLRLNPVRRKR